ncbi:MAG: hypothetical protein ABEI78_00985 [Candidatus Nanohaloarchaea archaeon]
MVEPFPNTMAKGDPYNMEQKLMSSLQKIKTSDQISDHNRKVLLPRLSPRRRTLNRQNRKLPDTDDIYFKEPPHAFLISQNADGDYMLFDFARIVGDNPITGQIEAVNKDEGYTLQLEEDTHNYVEGQGYNYSLL